jgi:RNA polymerase sigma factor (sigma-70 family)
MPSDAALLRQYSLSRDAEAFTELVRRHAGMVYGTALHVMGNPHDAEDVAQECFLDLVRKSQSISTSLAGWLHTTAMHRSLDSIRHASARSRHEEALMDNESRHEEPTWHEVAPHVDRALEGLPDEIRCPLVLHYLEGRSQQEVADELGINQSTVSRHLEKGVMQLREKLKKAGIVASAAFLTTLLGQDAATAAPAALVSSLGKMAIAGIGKAAVAETAGPKGGSSAAGFGAMKVKLAATVAAAAVAAVGGLIAYRELSGEAPTGESTNGGRTRLTSEDSTTGRDVAAQPRPTDGPAAPQAPTITGGEVVDGPRARFEIEGKQSRKGEPVRASPGANIGQRTTRSESRDFRQETKAQPPGEDGPRLAIRVRFARVATDDFDAGVARWFQGQSLGSSGSSNDPRVSKAEGGSSAEGKHLRELQELDGDGEAPLLDFKILGIIDSQRLPRVLEAIRARPFARVFPRGEAVTGNGGRVFVDQAWEYLFPNRLRRVMQGGRAKSVPSNWSTMALGLGLEVVPSLAADGATVNLGMYVFANYVRAITPVVIEGNKSVGGNPSFTMSEGYAKLSIPIGRTAVLQRAPPPEPDETKVANEERKRFYGLIFLSAQLQSETVRNPQ